jgi:hypothetical protein
MSAVLKEPAPAAASAPPPDAPERDEKLLDQALHETFPASDPISPALERVIDAPATPAVRSQFDSVGPIERRARWNARMTRTLPALVGFASFAVALSMLRALRRR